MRARPENARAYLADRTVLGALIALTAWLSLALARGPGELAAIWVGNGILAGWLLSRRTATWPGYVLTALLAEFPARLLAGDAPVYALAIAACNLIEAVGVAGIVRRAEPDTRNPRDWMRLGGVAAAATLAACAVAGVLAATVAHVLHGQPLLPELARWYAAHVVGMVVVATTTLVVLRERLGLLVAPGRGWNLVITLALVAAVTGAVFITELPLLFLAYPPLLLVAVRHGFAGVGLGVVTMALVAASATALGQGPFAYHGLDTNDRIALLQVLIAGACLMTIPACLAKVERDRFATRLAESERRYRMLADHSHDMIARVNADEERIYVSPSASEMLGWSPSELLGRHWDIVHPDDAQRQRDALREVLATGEPRTDIYRLRHRDGHYLWIEVAARSLPADDGGDRNDVVFAARNIDRRVAAEQALAESRLELERQSRVDALTDLANRRQLDERLDLALRRLHRQPSSLALLCMDIDRFKAINDGHGHAAGDAVLQAFARRLRACVRDTDLVARPGGDEFAILLEDVGPEGAEAVARKVLAEMARPVETGDVRLDVTTSIGIACTREPVDAATLMARADEALYAAKRAGRNRYHLSSCD